MKNLATASRILIACLSSVYVTACLQLDPAASERMAIGASSSVTGVSSVPSEVGRSTYPSSVDSALRNPRRLSADRAQDKRRKAAKVLEFFGVETGMTVLDLYSGGGYYTELLSYIVGPRGRVVAHNNTSFLSMARDELAVRYANGRLENVEPLLAENNKLRLPPNEFDVIIMIKSYHDVYFVSEDESWVKIDRPKLLHEIFVALKHGGVLGIVDHAADPGTPAEVGGQLHRIDPALVKRDMAAAGFRFDGELDILRDPADDRSQSVFAPLVRGWTDRAVLRFRKP